MANQITKRELMAQDKTSAYHEAGHALMCIILNRFFVDVWIGDTAQFLNDKEKIGGQLCLLDPPLNDDDFDHAHPWDLEDQALEDVSVLLGGMAANIVVQRMTFFAAYMRGGKDDYQKVEAILARLYGEDEKVMARYRLQKKANKVIRANLEHLHTIANALLEKRTMTYNEVREVLEPMAAKEAA